MTEEAMRAMALSIRSLTIDAIERANSGHPGLPLGAAELAACLYGTILKHNPANPSWFNRDRFVLSAGHGSMLLYAALHLSGYDVSLEDIKNFRQVGSRCPGHPEYGCTPGVEATTGPLGQGISMAVGFALAEAMLAARFNTDEHAVVDHHTYALVGEGCLMEGVASEASSFAGTMRLGKLIVFYDENHISIDGSTDLTFSEDVAKRYEAYGWQVLRGSMYSYTDIMDLTACAKRDDRHSLIILRSIIGKGAPTVEGSARAHGAPLGEAGVREAKKALGLDPACSFFVAPELTAVLQKRKCECAHVEDSWNELFEAWSTQYPEKRADWDAAFVPGGVSTSQLARVVCPHFEKGSSLATRTASGKVLDALCSVLPNLVGGSADLRGPNAVAVSSLRPFSAEHRAGGYCYFGVREFAMAAIVNGMQLHGGLRAFGATFMVFSDYFRPALRLAALMRIPSVFVLTHDSIFVGEDGPTHQPVETLAALRAIPNVLVLRPADAEETFEAWKIALLHRNGPVCIVLSRQNVPVFEKSDSSWRSTVEESGAYVVREGGATPELTVLASGSEVDLALRAAQLSKRRVRVVSVLCKERFEAAGDEVQRRIQGGARVVVAEAGVYQGWGAWAKREKCLVLDRFGESGPGTQVAQALEFTAEALVEIILDWLA